MTEVAPPSQVAHRLSYLIRHSTLDDLVEELSLISPQDSLSCSDFHLSLLLSVPMISTTTRNSYHCIATFCLLLGKGINPFVEKGSDGKLLEWELEEVKNGVLRDIFRAEWEEGKRCWSDNETYELRKLPLIEKSLSFEAYNRMDYTQLKMSQDTSIRRSSKRNDGNWKR